MLVVEGGAEGGASHLTGFGFTFLGFGIGVLEFGVSVFCFMFHLRGYCHWPYGVAALCLNVIGVAADA